MDYPEGTFPVPASVAGGSKVAAQGGARIVWHTTEGDSIAGAVAAYRSHTGWPHITWDHRDGSIAGHLPASVSARSVQNLSGGVETNRYGTVLQVEVVAHAAEPFTDSGRLIGLDRVLAWARANGVPDVWPMGQPLAYGPDERRPGVSPAAYGLNNGQRNAGVWLAQGGHYGHSQVPENDHGDPGRVNIDMLLAGGGGSAQVEDDGDMDALAAENLDHTRDVFVFGPGGAFIARHRGPYGAFGISQSGLDYTSARSIKVRDAGNSGTESYAICDRLVERSQDVDAVLAGTQPGPAPGPSPIVVDRSEIEATVRQRLGNAVPGLVDAVIADLTD